MIPWPLPPPLACRSTAEDRGGGEIGGGGGAGRTARADGCIVVAAVVDTHHTPGIHDTVDVMKALDAYTVMMLVLVCTSHVYIALYIASHVYIACLHISCVHCFVSCVHCFIAMFCNVVFATNLVSSTPLLHQLCICVA